MTAPNVMMPDRKVRESLLHVGSIESPAVCPKCKSKDLTLPFQGRRTNLWLATCKDCGTPLRSVTRFEVTPRRELSRYKNFQHDRAPQPERPYGTTLMAAAIRAGQPLQAEWLPYREPGQEG